MQSLEGVFLETASPSYTLDRSRLGPCLCILMKFLCIHFCELRRVNIEKDFGMKWNLQSSWRSVADKILMKNPPFLDISFVREISPKLWGGFSCYTHEMVNLLRKGTVCRCNVMEIKLRAETRDWLKKFFLVVFFGRSHMINDSQSWVGRTNFRAWIPPGHPLKSNPGNCIITCLELIFKGNQIKSWNYIITCLELIFKGN